MTAEFVCTRCLLSPPGYDCTDLACTCCHGVPADYSVVGTVGTTRLLVHDGSALCGAVVTQGTLFQHGQWHDEMAERMSDEQRT